MSLKAMLEAAKQPLSWFTERKEDPEQTPVEVAVRLHRPISSLDDLRKMMKQISDDNAAAGNESFEEFYDFGEDADFEDIPAPAQMKHDAVLLARDRDFEAEVLDAKEKYKDRLNAEAREQLLNELKAKQSKEEKEEEA